MPTVTRQSNRTTSSKKSEGVLDRITPLVDHDSGGLHISLYGRSKTGKTRLLSTFPKPLLIIGSEDGTRSIRGTKGVDFVLIRHSDEVGELLTIAQDRGYASLALDTASRLGDQILAEILGIEKLPEQKSWGMAARDQYAQQGLKLKTLLRLALDLPLHVAITAHERNFSEESNTPIDIVFPSVGSALSPSVAGWLNGAVDYVAQTFIRDGVEEKVVTINGKKTVTQKKTGIPEYCLRIGPHPVYQTGFRVPVDCELPDVIVNPDFEKILKIANGLQKK